MKTKKEVLMYYSELRYLHSGINVAETNGWKKSAELEHMMKACEFILEIDCLHIKSMIDIRDLIRKIDLNKERS